MFKETSAYRRSLIFILIVFFCFSFLYSWFTPIFEYPDEQGHFSVVRYIADNGKLPELKILGGLHESYNPPLYYGILALVYKSLGQPKLTTDFPLNPAWGKTDHRVFIKEPPLLLSERMYFQLLRSVNIFFALGILVIVYYISLVFLKNKKKALLPVLFAAFLPQFTWFSGSINPDILAAFLSSLAIYFLIKIQQKNKTLDYLFLGIILGLGFLCKYQLLLFLLVFLALFVHQKLKKNKNYVGFFLFSGVVITISGWFYIRNYLLYEEFIPVTFYKQFYSSLLANNDFFSLFFWLNIIISLFLTFFGEFNHGYFFLPAWMYAGYFLLILLVLVGLKNRQKKSIGWLLKSILFFNLVIIIAFALSFSTIIQGRFLFPSIGIISLLVIQGLLWWNLKNKIFFRFILTSYVLLNVFSLFFVLIPGYK